MASAILSIAPERNLTRYLQEIRKFAMLTPEEELSLAHRWRDKQDVERPTNSSLPICDSLRKSPSATVVTACRSEN